MFYKDFPPKLLANKETPAQSRMETEQEVAARINEWIESWEGGNEIINIESIIVPDSYAAYRLCCFRVWVK